MVHQVTPTESGVPYRNSAGICLFNAQGLVLVAERSDSKGCWQMPQGGIQIGEDPSLAVLREMKEEIGTNHAVIIGRLPEPLRYDFPDYFRQGGPFNGKYRGQEQIWFALLFKGEDNEINLSGENDPEPAEFVAWKWVELPEIINLIVDFKRPVYERVAATFAPLAEKLKRGEQVEG
jgi:putative (di)nucleoside polyphosphate hydrolase